MSKISLKHSGGNVVSLNSPTSAPTSADVAFKLPNADGTSGQVLKTDGSGNLSFGADTGGKILQVLQNTKTNTASTSSTSLVDTGLSVSITPSSTSSKILVMFSLFISVPANTYSAGTSILRDSTEVFVGDASGSSGRMTTFMWPDGGRDPSLHSHTFLDSPNTTSSITYKIQWKSFYSGQTIYLGRSDTASTASQHGTTP